MESHVELLAEDLMRSGMSRDEAVRQARLKLGAAEAVRESYSAERGLPVLETLLQDCRYARRSLGKSPAFVLVVVLTLALGIGANAAIFTLIHALMLRSLPVARPETLVRLGNANDCCVGQGTPDNGEFSLFTTGTYEFLRKNTTAEFEELAAIQAGWTYRPVVVRREGSEDPPRSVMGEFVSGNYFRTLGLGAEAGRLLTDRDDAPGAALMAVMSYETWRTRFNSDPAIVGSTFRVNTKPVTVVGIAAREFYGDRLATSPPEFYFPIEAMPPIANVTYVHDPDEQWLYMMGRLRPGVSMAQAQQKVSGLFREQLATTPRYSSKDRQEALRRAHIVLTPGGAGIQAMQEYFNSRVKMLMVAAGLVLLIACANIANLLLVRGTARRSEMNVRTALGARRGRIVRQLLTESVLLSAAGGLAGLLVAYGGTRMLLAMAFPGGEHIPIEARPSVLVLGFACGLSLLTGVLFGVAPAWIASQADPVEALRSNARTVSGGSTFLQRALVVVQAALSVVLLVGAGLFAESLNKLQHVDLKLDPVNRYIVHINPQTAGYAQHQVLELYRTIEERLHGLPAVEKVGIASYTPMEDDNNGWGVVVQGKPALPDNSSSYLKINADYFDSVGTRLIAGRNVDARDTATSQPVAVVNQEFVRKFFAPDENPLGQHFGNGVKNAGDFEIVGVVEDTVYQSVTYKDHRMYFVPLPQHPFGAEYKIDEDENMYANGIVIETTRPVPEMEELARRTLAGINPNLAVQRFQTFSAQIADQFTEDRLLSRLTMLFAGLALALATLGIYGVTAYGVARRTSEIGIRMALGAQRGTVTVGVMRGALMQVLVGLGVGVPASLASVRLVAAQLYEVKHVDGVILGGAIAGLCVAGAIAALIPARRAASIEPAVALRTE
ncbi:ABC transporter permease [Acidobacteria bacterium AB60]|nr:ABC transporter permease [Acidobacteria bacterium AB60]